MSLHTFLSDTTLHVALAVRLMVPAIGVHRGLAPPSRCALPGAAKLKGPGFPRPSRCGVYEAPDEMVTEVTERYFLLVGLSNISKAQRSRLSTSSLSTRPDIP